MNFQLPIPSFEDIQKSLQFWIDQQDKWFYFETAVVQSGSFSQSEIPNQLRAQTRTSMSTSRQISKYVQTRIVGRIYDVVYYPPSLLLSDVGVSTVTLTYDGSEDVSVVSSEDRERYGLVFSQITYYEPIKNIEAFWKKDKRVIAH